MDVRRTHKPGTPRPGWEKCTFGFLMVLILLLIILGPILLFSTLNPILEINNVNTGTISLELSSSSGDKASSIFEIFDVHNLDISTVTPEMFRFFKANYAGIENEWADRMQRVTLLTYSETVWEISPASFRTLKGLLERDEEKFYLTVNWAFTRPHPPGAEVARGSNTILLSEKMKKMMHNIFEEQFEGTILLDVPNLFPKFLHLGATPTTKVMRIGTNSLDPYSNVLSSCLLEYKKEQGQRYWILKRKSYMIDKKFDEPFQNQDNAISMFLVSDQVVGSFLSKNGMELSVVGLYVTIVLAIGRFVRLIFDKISQRVIYEEMPRTTDLMEFCDGIYIARLEGDLKREQYLYDMLIKLYRSPELLLKLTGTRPGKED